MIKTTFGAKFGVILWAALALALPASAIAAGGPTCQAYNPQLCSVVGTGQTKPGGAVPNATTVPTVTVAKPGAPVPTGTATKPGAPVPNDTVASGTVPNGTVANGTVANGTPANGTAAGALPFTGLDLGLLAAGACLLLGGGMLVRRLSRPSA